MTASRKPPESVRLLADLVQNTLDPGYRAAAERRGGHPAEHRRLNAVLVAAGALIAGFLLVTAYVHTHRGAPAADRVHDRLVDRVRSAQRGTDDLADRADTLQRQLDAVRAQALPASGSLARALARDTTAAGTTAVTGPGLTVRLADPPAPSATPTPGRGGTTPLRATNTLTDRDVRSVVNELWRDGAEAIAVNGIRLTPNTAIRFAGEAVLVDFQPVTSPYRIDAIGDADRLAVAFAQSDVAGRYQTLSGAVGIGFSFTDADRLELPAGTPGQVRYAVEGPAPGTSSRGRK